MNKDFIREKTISGLYEDSTTAITNARIVKWFLVVNTL